MWNMDLVYFMEKEGLGKVFEYCFCMESSKKNEGERSYMREKIFTRRCVKVERFVVFFKLKKICALFSYWNVKSLL